MINLNTKIAAETDGHPSHLPTPEFVASLRLPVKIMMSACLSGRECGFDGTSYGEYPVAKQVISSPDVRPIFFCPEDYSFGTPRDLCDIHGGNGFDVLDGKAKVLTESGEDWTEGMVASAYKMLELAQKHEVDLAILMDVSAACGSQVIYEGARRVPQAVYQKGPGVCAALLIRNGIRVISQRDYKTLGTLLSILDSNYQVNPEAVDHHETSWYRKYFKL